MPGDSRDFLKWTEWKRLVCLLGSYVEAGDAGDLAFCGPSRRSHDGICLYFPTPRCCGRKIHQHLGGERMEICEFIEPPQC